MGGNSARVPEMIQESDDDDGNGAGCVMALALLVVGVVAFLIIMAG